MYTKTFSDVTCIQIEITCSTLVTMALKELTGNLAKGQREYTSVN